MATASTDSKNDLLIERLIERTKKRDVSWKPSPHTDTFLAVLHSGTVEISRHVFRDEDNIPHEWFELAVLTAHAAVAAVLSSDTGLSVGVATRVSGQRLAELFQLARANALRADEMVDGLLSELAT
jgi:hypothetical protein